MSEEEGEKRSGLGTAESLLAFLPLPPQLRILALIAVVGFGVIAAGVLVIAMTATSSESNQVATALQCHCGAADTSAPPTSSAAEGNSSCGGGSVGAEETPTLDLSGLTVDRDDPDIPAAIRTCPSRLCAAKLAGAYVGTSADIAAVIRTVVYQASRTGSSGCCGRGSGEDPSAAGTDACQSTSNSPAQGSAAVTLPTTLAGQAASGQRMARSAISDGDLVFWNNGANGIPAYEGIAVGNGRMVTVGPTRQLITAAIPDEPDVIGRRVLGGT
ncbi:MAG: hypothetical protein J2P18_11365 [Nocardia sp.]|nr:hypothetical protein [Nocardia sp.]